MLKLPEKPAVIVEIPLKKNVWLCIKREDLIHPEISGNKYWKLFFNINDYLESSREIHDSKTLQIITFGGAFSNHIAAVSALAKDLKMNSLGVIRGEELSEKIHENPTLKFAEENGMQFRFVTRDVYRDKISLAENLRHEFPEALIIPEGGTNMKAVEGVQFMLSEETAQFDYLCAAVGTGGTLTGISKFAKNHQKVLGFPVVKDSSLQRKILELSGKENFELISADYGGYGKITDEVVAFINWFYNEYKIPLDPIYTGKMMKKVFDLIEENYFPCGSKILAFHTGGLQGISGANVFLKSKNQPLINF